MLAIAAAVIFGIDLLLDLFDVKRSDLFTWQTLIAAGLFCLALHFAGIGTTRPTYRRRR
jgi:hypothetical protein